MSDLEDFGPGTRFRRVYSEQFADEEGLVANDQMRKVRREDTSTPYLSIQSCYSIPTQIPYCNEKNALENLHAAYWHNLTDLVCVYVRTLGGVLLGQVVLRALVEAARGVRQGRGHRAHRAAGAFSLRCGGQERGPVPGGGGGVGAGRAQEHGRLVLCAGTHRDCHAGPERRCQTRHLHWQEDHGVAGGRVGRRESTGVHVHEGVGKREKEESAYRGFRTFRVLFLLEHDCIPLTLSTSPLFDSSNAPPPLHRYADVHVREQNRIVEEAIN